MEMHDLRTKTTEELHELVRTLKAQLAELRFQVANMQLKEVRTIRSVRTQIAQAMTALKEKETSSTSTTTK